VLGRVAHALLWNPFKLEQMPFFIIFSVCFPIAAYGSLKLFGWQENLNIKLFNELLTSLPVEGEEINLQILNTIN
jgi:hypothetical protein